MYIIICYICFSIRDKLIKSTLDDKTEESNRTRLY